MKKVFLGMLLVTLGFATMSVSTIPDDVFKTSLKIQNADTQSAFGPTYTAPWLGVCCESPLTAIERDIAKRGYPATTPYLIIGTTSNTVTYKIN